MTLQVERGARLPSLRAGRADPRDDLVTPARVASVGLRHDVERARADGDGADQSEVSRLLATRLIAGLDTRPFRPTAAQIAWVRGGELVRGEAQESRSRMAAGRYAALFTDHVVQDVTIDGAPGAYARIWLCSRQAFIQSMTSAPSGPLAGEDLFSWENEGGAAS